MVVLKSVEELYRFWRDLDRVPLVMRQVEVVQRIDGRRSHWIARSPVGEAIAWDSEITADAPPNYFAWRDHRDGQLQNEGELGRAPAGWTRYASDDRLRFPASAGALRRALTLARKTR